jgi:hypothetical protein
MPAAARMVADSVVPGGVQGEWMVETHFAKEGLDPIADAFAVSRDLGVRLVEYHGAYLRLNAQPGSGLAQEPVLYG